MPALNGKMECGRMTRRQELYHPLMCAPTNGDRLSLPQEASTPLSTPNPPTPSNTFNTPASVGSGSVVVGRSVGGWISILRRKATKAASSCACPQSFHSRGMGVASNLVRLSEFLKQSVFFLACQCCKKLLNWVAFSLYRSRWPLGRFLSQKMFKSEVLFLSEKKSICVKIK